MVMDNFMEPLNNSSMNCQRTKNKKSAIFVFSQNQSLAAIDFGGTSLCRRNL